MRFDLLETTVIGDQYLIVIYSICCYQSINVHTRTCFPLSQYPFLIITFLDSLQTLKFDIIGPDYNNKSAAYVHIDIY